MARRGGIAAVADMSKDAYMQTTRQGSKRSQTLVFDAPRHALHDYLDALAALRTPSGATAVPEAAEAAA